MTHPMHYWLHAWLQPITDTIPFKLNNHTYIQLKTFRIAFYIHGVYKNIDTNEYHWYVIENNMININNFLKATRYRSYYELLQDMAIEYSQKWNKL
jgi:hypothetical protein